MISVERRRELRSKTLASLTSAGFDSIRVFEDNGIRPFGNWLLGLAEIIIREPMADYYAMFQDDIIASKNLRAYLERTCPVDARGYWNLFTFPENHHFSIFDRAGGRRPEQIVGWYESNQLGKGAVALVFHREAAVRLLGRPYMWNRPKDPDRGWRNIDGGVVQAMVLEPRDGWREFVHNPSLVQHVGTDSTLKHTSGWHGSQAVSCCFRGEDFDCLSLLESAHAVG
jgi:hypothetical protein